MDERVAIVEGDIIAQDVDAIVNAAKESLLGGGGVDGAIHRAAGPGLVQECRRIGGCPTGEARLSGGHALIARHVIHAVGPVWRGGGEGEDKLLAGCYRSALALAESHRFRSIAFPSISTGAYRFPLERATRIAITAVLDHLGAGSALEKVVLVCFGAAAHRCYGELFAEIGGSQGDETGPSGRAWFGQGAPRVPRRGGAIDN